MTWVFDHSEAELGARLVLLVLAEYAHDDGSMAWPSLETMAAKTRLSERGVRYALRKLELAGEIVQMGCSKRGTRIYRLLMGEGGKELPGANLAGGKTQPSRGEGVAPEPTTDPSDKRGSARERARISGKPVKPDAWELSEQVLAEFNSQAGTKLRFLTSAGQPSEATKRIYLRLVNYPDLTLEDHADIIRRTLLSRWWGEGPVSIGVVYGPKVFEDNITRVGAPEDATKAEKKARAADDLAAIERIIGRKDAA